MKLEFYVFDIDSFFKKKIKRIFNNNISPKIANLYKLKELWFQIPKSYVVLLSNIWNINYFNKELFINTFSKNQCLSNLNDYIILRSALSIEDEYFTHGLFSSYVLHKNEFLDVWYDKFKKIILDYIFYINKVWGDILYKNTNFFTFLLQDFISSEYSGVITNMKFDIFDYFPVKGSYYLTLVYGENIGITSWKDSWNIFILDSNLEIKFVQYNRQKYVYRFWTKKIVNKYFYISDVILENVLSNLKILFNKFVFWKYKNFYIEFWITKSQNFYFFQIKLF